MLFNPSKPVEDELMDSNGGSHHHDQSETMKWLSNLFKKESRKTGASLLTLNDRLRDFLTLLHKHDQVLAVLGDMEEKHQKAEPFDIHYIRSSLNEIRHGMNLIVEKMIALGGEKYGILRERCAVIESEIASVCPGAHPIEPDEFIIPFNQLDRSHAPGVGSKNAQLGELKTKLSIPVPEGFAITAWAYQHFLTVNRLQTKIDEYLDKVDLSRLDELEQVSREVQLLITTSPVPRDLEDAIYAAYDDLKSRVPLGRVALRSSAIAEDAFYSFAGQYATILNVRENHLIDHYKDILASQFSAKAIYYLLGHTLSEAEFAMSVGCVAMVDAAAGGVVYTRNPIHPDRDCLLVHSVFGLGKSLVDGTLTPDVFRIARRDGTIEKSHIAPKPTRLVLKNDEGIEEEKVPEEKQTQASIEPFHLTQLVDYALKIEAHYGCPQDIEWAIDREGRLCFLQTRPLRVIQPQIAALDPYVPGMKTILSGGITVYPGVGAGPVFHIASTQNLPDVPDGAVLVAPHPFPGLVTVMNKINALVTEIGGVASHMATLAREVRLPTLVGVKEARQLPSNQTVTVDATGGCIFDGIHPDLGERRCMKHELFEDTARYQLLHQLLSKISPLNLLNPADEDFVASKCLTYHDVIRFAHQKALEEMFAGAQKMRDKHRLGARLKSDIPLPVNIISIEKECLDPGKKWVEADELCSVLMQSFWQGIKDQGWPSQRPTTDVKGFMSAVATTMTMGSQPEFQENSFAIVSKEYMILSLNLGYHFTTIEAICANEKDKSYIRFQHKGGGAPFDRRVRRVRILSDVFAKMGYEYISKGDFFEATISYLSCRIINEKLRLLGRLCMLTKQLDMALSNDAIAEWYSEDIIKKMKL
ncbi:MAG: hypothetical protein C4527_22420 [Candidatus Omnitrophota bacterium]|jgi:pyruvate,water dikinase|nr:MAG: hypothetical protein C4527_22420 [Candidatus Omnitrophota bacterium]